MTPTDHTRPAPGPAPDAGHTETPGAREGLRGLLDMHTGIRVFEGQVLCHPCGRRIFHPDRGLVDGRAFAHAGQMVGEAAHAAHLTEVMLPLLAEAWDEGRRAGVDDLDQLDNPYRTEGTNS